MAEYEFQKKAMDVAFRNILPQEMRLIFNGMKTKGERMWMLFSKELTSNQQTVLSNAVNSYIPQSSSNPKEEYASLSSDAERIDFMAGKMGLK